MQIYAEGKIPMFVAANLGVSLDASSAHKSTGETSPELDAAVLTLKPELGILKCSSRDYASLSQEP